MQILKNYFKIHSLKELTSNFTHQPTSTKYKGYHIIFFFIWYEDGGDFLCSSVEICNSLAVFPLSKVKYWYEIRYLRVHTTHSFNSHSRGNNNLLSILHFFFYTTICTMDINRYTLLLFPRMYLHIWEIFSTSFNEKRMSNLYFQALVRHYCNNYDL